MKNEKLVKTISWMVVSGLLITFTTLMETGMIRQSIMAAIWACMLKTPIYWLHEHAFAMFANRQTESEISDYIPENDIIDEQIKLTVFDGGF